MHHVGDAATGKLLSTKLDRPVTPLSRAERLSQLGQQFYPPIFWAPTHRLTPRYPYQASPQGFVDFSFTSTMSSVGDEPTGRADWLLQYIVPPWTGRMDAVLRDAPAGRCLLSLLLGAASLPGQVGHIRIEVRGQPAENAPLIASFDIPVQGDDFTEHIFDLVFGSEPDRSSHSLGRDDPRTWLRSGFRPVWLVDLWTRRARFRTITAASDLVTKLPH